MKRIFRRREPGQPPRRGVLSLFRGRGRARGQRLPGYKRLPSVRLPGWLPRWFRRKPAPAPVPAPDGTVETEQVVVDPGPQSFKDRGNLRRRLRFLRRARELGFRDIGGLIFDMRRFERSRPDLLDAKLDALLAVDQELRALERILDDRRPFHELREPGISSCARCGALHSSEANFCPQCGLQFGGPRAMGEVGGAIAAPPQPPAAPGAAPAPARTAAQPEWPWPAHQPPADQPTAPTVQGDPVTEQLTVAYVPVLQSDPPESADEPPAPEAAAEAVTEPDAKPAAVPEAEPTAEPQAKPSAAKPAAKPKAEPPTGETAPATADDDGASAPAEAEQVPAAKKPAARKPRVRKPSTPKPAAKPATNAKPHTEAPDPAEPAGPHDDDIPAAEQQTEIHVPPRASDGS